MSKNLKIFLSSFVLALPFWWGVNVSESKLENFFVEQIIGNNPQAITAQVSAPLVKEILAAEPEPKQNLEIKAKAALAVEFNPQGEKEILYQMNEKEKLPIASLTKLITALISSDIYPVEQKLQITKEAVDQPGERGWLRPGEMISVNDLLNMALIESSNDAAYALSEGKLSINECLFEQERFVELMNLKIAGIELKDTELFNPTGLDNGNFNNYSTADDLVKLAYHINKEYPAILEISNRTEHQALDSLDNPHHLVKNINQLVGKIPNVVGGKTGYTEKAGGCIILILEDDDSLLVNVILGADSPEARFQEMEKLINWIYD